MVNEESLNKLKELVRRFEGLRLRAYLCPAGIWTCGYGSTGPNINKYTMWTKEQAEERMERDALKFLFGTFKLCPLSETNKLAAVADFAYNLGLTRLAGSTLRRKINNNEYEEAAEEFGKWVRGGGRILPGLVIRRQAEKELFISQ